MKLKTVLSLTIVFFVIFWGVDPMLQPPSSLRGHRPEFPDHYILALQYSLSICLIKDCRQTTRANLPMEFSIHGLWPKNMDESDPLDTTKDEFDKNKLDSSLVENLKKYWFNAYEYDEPELYYTFWSHEWNNHGRKSNLDLEDYFATTVNLYGKFVEVFEDLVQKNKYLPGVPFSFKQFENSFAANLAIPWIKRAQLKNGTIVVKEMQFRIEPTDFGEFRPHPSSRTDEACIEGIGGLAMLPSTEEPRQLWNI